MNIRIEPKPDCPECGRIMTLRQPRPDQDWHPFWGCSQFPLCRGARNIMPDGTPEEDDYEDDDWGMDWHPGHPSNYGDR